MRFEEMAEELIETRKARIWMGEEGITMIQFKPGAEATLADIKENFAAHRKLNKGRRSPVFTDITGMKYIERDARVYSAGKEAQKDIRALAVLIGSPVARMIGSFFMGLNKPLFPTQLFTSEDEAVEWLKGFLE